VDRAVVAPSNELYLNHSYTSSVQLLENRFQVEANYSERARHIINKKKENLNSHIFIGFKIRIMTNIFAL
jgi:hypothetical protein